VSRGDKVAPEYRKAAMLYYRQSGNISHPVAPKTTKNQKNCTLISQQQLNKNLYLVFYAYFKTSFLILKAIY
jgi:hypothetical protein